MDIITKTTDRIGREFCDVEQLSGLTVDTAVEQIVAHYESTNTTGVIDVRVNTAIIASLGGGCYVGGKLKWCAGTDSLSRTVNRANAVKQNGEHRIDFTLYV